MGAKKSYNATTGQWEHIGRTGLTGISRGRNRIINGDFSVNQRAFTSLTTGDYGFDRWYAGRSGGTVTYSVSSSAVGELPESASAYARISSTGQSAAGDYAVLAQRIESVRTLSGKTVTVSFWAKATSGTPKVAVQFTQAFGTGGSPSTAVEGTATHVTLSTTLTRYTVTIDIPSITGKTIGTTGGDYLRLNLWTSAGTTYSTQSGSLGIQNTTIDFWGVQVEEGHTATDFEQKTYAEELRACQRYYYSDATWVGTGSYPVPIRHPVPMRSVVNATGGGAGYSGGSVVSVLGSVPYQTTAGVVTLTWNAEL